MNKLFSMIMVIVMVFSAVAGMAESVQEPKSIEVKISLDVQKVMAMSGTVTAENAEQSAQIVKVIEDALNVLTIRGVCDQETYELDLYAGEDLLASAGIQAKGEGITVASSLLGSQVISVSPEQLAQLQQQAMASMSQSSSGVDVQGMAEQLKNLDWEQIGKDFSEVFGKAGQAFSEKTGEAETGEFVVDDMAFTVKVPVNITYTEFMELLLGSAKELAGKESVKPLLDIVAKDTDVAAEIDKELETLKKQAEEQKYALNIANYSNEAGSSYFVMDLSHEASEDGTVKAESMHAGFGSADNGMKLLVTSEGFGLDLTTAAAEDGSSTMKMNLTGNGLAAAVTASSDAAGNSEGQADIQMQGMPIRIHTMNTVDGEQVSFQQEIFFMSMDKPMVTVTGSAGKGGELVSVFEGENVKMVPFEKLTDTEDPTASSQLSMTLMASLLKAVTTLTKNLPEDSAEWVNDQVKQMMNPGAVTKTPEGEPAANP